MTQTEWILNALKKGSVTAMQALEGCGCFRLAARIADLREQGHEIETRTLELNNGKRIAQYFLKKATHN